MRRRWGTSARRSSLEGVLVFAIDCVPDLSRRMAPEHNQLHTHERVIIAHHLVPTLYGHWPPNDLRGSGSSDFYDEKFAALGPIHQGRKPAHLQPSKRELREFHRNVEPLLNFPIFWVDDAKRQVIAEAFGKVVRENRYTCYACAICSNHMHLVIRKHRDTFEQMWELLTDAATAALRAFNDVGEHHPVFAQRPYGVFLYTPDDIGSRIDYIKRNPLKEGLAPQEFDFVTVYDGWPLAKSKS